LYIDGTKGIRHGVSELTARFPLYPNRLRQGVPQQDALGAD
jgi:hypothetical protein